MDLPTYAEACNSTPPKRHSRTPAIAIGASIALCAAMLIILLFVLPANYPLDVVFLANPTAPIGHCATTTPYVVSNHFMVYFISAIFTLVVAILCLVGAVGFWCAR